MRLTPLGDSLDERPSHLGLRRDETDGFAELSPNVIPSSLRTLQTGGPAFGVVAGPIPDFDHQPLEVEFEYFTSTAEAPTALFDLLVVPRGATLVALDDLVGTRSAGVDADTGCASGHGLRLVLSVEVGTHEQRSAG